MDEKPTGSLWVGIKGRARTGDVIMRVCYRPPGQKEALYRQIGAASISQARILMGDSTAISFRGTTQQGRSNPGGSYNVLITSFCE